MDWGRKNLFISLTCQTAPAKSSAGSEYQSVSHLQPEILPQRWNNPRDRRISAFTWLTNLVGRRWRFIHSYHRIRHELSCHLDVIRFHRGAGPARGGKQIGRSNFGRWRHISAFPETCRRIDTQPHTVADDFSTVLDFR